MKKLRQDGGYGVDTKAKLYTSTTETENKRYSFNWERGRPNFWDNYCDLADCYLTCEDVVNRLNELAEENKQLKQQVEDLEFNLQEVRKMVMWNE